MIEKNQRCGFTTKMKLQLQHQVLISEGSLVRVDKLASNIVNVNYCVVCVSAARVLPALVAKV